MKQQLLTLSLTALTFTAVACGGGDGGNILEVCDNGTCVSVSENEQGRFNVITTKESGHKNLPQVSVDDDTLTLSCLNDESTEKGLITFTCDESDDREVNAQCIRGVVRYTNGGEVFTSGCRSFNFYCDENGFYHAEICNDTGKALVMESETSEIQ